jgi:hypothetical protein
LVLFAHYLVFQIKLCITLLIKAASECHKGIDNLWADGNGAGAREYPAYGQYIPKHYIKAFFHVLPLLWAPEEYWFRDQRELPWDVVKLLFEEINALRCLLLCILFLVLDESMYGFRPKTSPHGGLPNISFEPRKPVSLGSMVRNGLDAITGIFAFRDPVEDMTSQRLKPFMQSNNTMHTPGGGDLPVCTAEVLRQVKGSGLVKGGWVCGDAWFGSVVSAVELKIRLGVYSSKC